MNESDSIERELSASLDNLFDHLELSHMLEKRQLSKFDDSSSSIKGLVSEGTAEALEEALTELAVLEDDLANAL